MDPSTASYAKLIFGPSVGSISSRKSGGSPKRRPATSSNTIGGSPKRRQATSCNTRTAFIIDDHEFQRVRDLILEGVMEEELKPDYEMPMSIVTSEDTNQRIRPRCRAVAGTNRRARSAGTDLRAPSAPRPASLPKPASLAGQELEMSRSSSKSSSSQSGPSVFGAPKVAPRKPPEKKKMEKVYQHSGRDRNALGYIVTQEESTKSRQESYFDSVKKMMIEKAEKEAALQAKQKGAPKDIISKAKTMDQQTCVGQRSRQWYLDENVKKKQLILTDGGWISG